MIKINSEKLINQNLICKKHRFKQLLYILNFITQSLNIFQSFQQTQQKKLSMTCRHHAYSVANGINQDLIKKVEKLIVKRQAVFKQMNNYTLDKLSTIITETNQQLAYNVKGNTISQVQDVGTTKIDSFMSIPEAKVTRYRTLQSQVQQFSSMNETKKVSIHSNSRKDFLVFQKSKSITPQERSIALRKSSFSSSSRVFQPVNIDKNQEQQRYVQALRINKKIEQEIMLREARMAQESKQKRLYNDLSSKNVMYDYQCRIAKIQDFRAKKNLKLDYLNRKVNENTNINKKVTLSEGRQLQKKEIKDKVNITLKTQQEEESKQKRRGLFKADQSIKTEVQSDAIVVNYQTLDQTESAIRLLNDGIKLKINNRQFSTIVEPPTISELTIKSKMSRSHYLEFKKVEQNRKGIKMKNGVKPRSKSEFKVRTEASADNNKSQEQQKNGKLDEINSRSENDLKLQTKISIALGSTKRDSTLTNQSRIQVFNGQLHKQLLKEEKRKHINYLGDRKQTLSPKPRRDRLNEIDRYNLMYLKYKGNPPSYLQQVTESLKTSTVQASKQRQNLLKASAIRKYNWINSTRIVENKRQRAFKTIDC